MGVQRVPVLSTEFQPRKGYVLVRPGKKKTEKKTEAGVIIPVMDESVVDKRPTFGEVIAVGQDIEDIPVGCVVFWPSTDGIDFEFEDGEFVLLRYQSVIGVKKLEEKLDV